jgi:hypothetical protein
VGGWAGKVSKAKQKKKLSWGGRGENKVPKKKTEIRANQKK